MMDEEQRKLLQGLAGDERGCEGKAVGAVLREIEVLRYISESLQSGIAQKTDQIRKIKRNLWMFEAMITDKDEGLDASEELIEAYRQILDIL